MSLALSLSSELSDIPTSDVSSVPSSPIESLPSLPTTPQARRTSPTRSPTPYRKFKQYRYVGKQNDGGQFNKVRETLVLWRRLRINFKSFLRLWLLSKKSHGNLSRDIRTEQFREVFAEQDVRCILGEMPSSSYDWKQIFTELEGLSDHRYFNTFMSENAHEWCIDLDEVRGIIQEQAPEWFKFLDLLLRNRRSTEPLVREQLPKGIIGQMYMITAVVCRSRQRKTSNAFAKHLGLYLLSSGTKRRVIETFAGMGLCDTYHHINLETSGMAEHAKKHLPRLARDPQTVIVYDNFNFKDTVREQVVGSNHVMRNMTT
ncbi:hypothetical protein P152DRAFT_48723 [Eremomyces bilateralis CBS 781.70]|uniref:Uncharacterized protein n=1 Tax=Eremomyces bilateralis CBS 781.70 TaxID=1392243 RepID=A0A6G1G1K6_9PEZI|nr:uncharacterized protein P152DRAFT_48723 [Eremomyces bilateralis CBS 781.70]KAF1811689.1 hypothetical protein P152DRAFT_48723 [Eremomyces bilateralis CBS 781.70]